MNKIFIQHCRVTKWCGPKCVNNREVVTSRCHSNEISGSQETVVLQTWDEKEKEKMDRYEFPVSDSTDRAYFSSIVRQCKWPSLSGNIVEIQKFCYHGNVTSHLSSLYALLRYSFTWYKTALLESKKRTGSSQRKGFSR